MLPKSIELLIEKIKRYSTEKRTKKIIIGVLGLLLLSTISVPVYANESLPSDETQQEQAEAFGLPTEQPNRTSVSGEVVDKSQSPLGVSNITYYGVNQLVEVDNNLSLKRRVDTGVFGGSSRTYGPVTMDAFWTWAVKSVTAADIDGNGKQEVVLAGYYGKDTSELKIKIMDYSAVSADAMNGTPVIKEYVVGTVNTDSIDTSNTKKSMEVVAGDFNKDNIDEIAIMVGNQLFVLKADMMACTTIASAVFDATNPLVRDKVILHGAYQDLMAADTDCDGFEELQVILADGFQQELLIFNDIALDAPTRCLLLNAVSESGSTMWLTGAAMDFGDVYGEGEKSIVITGREFGTNIPKITTVKYNTYTDSYDDSLSNTIFALDVADFKAVKSALGIQCVDFEVVKPGDPEYVVIGGFVYRYDTVTAAFVKKAVKSVTSNTDGNNVEKSLGSITNVNVKKDSTYILDTLAGGFDEAVLSDMSLSGKEEVYMLNFNEWYGNTYLYKTRCYMDDNGDLVSVMTKVWEKDQPFYHNALCTVDIFNRGLQLSFEPDKSVFAFSNPTIVAALSATPYYSELEDEYAGLGNVGTVYGTDKTDESSKSNGITADIGLSFGYTQGVGVFGIKLAEFAFETDVTNSFAYAWSKGNSISKAISYTNYYNDDAVVVMVVPYDIYYFKVYNTENGVESEMAVNVPYSPISKIMPLSEYNAVATNIDNAPIIGDEVMNHTIGDPRSYPTSSTGLSNIEGQDVLLGGTSKNESENFMSTGIGSSHTEQSITTTSTTGKSFDYALDINVSFNSNILGVTSGVSAGAGYTHNATISSSESTIRTGQVASIPLADKQYEFQWCLAAYNYELEAGDETQTCTVINYLTKPIGVYPAEQPVDFKVADQKLSTTELKWNPAEGAAGYRLYRAVSADGPYTIMADLAGKSNTKYLDTTTVLGEKYYYNLVAYNSKDSVSTLAEADTLAITGMTVTKQPQLLYEEGENLNLKDLLIMINYSNATTEEVGFDMIKDKMTFSISDGTSLQPTQSGVPVTITYSLDNKSVNTQNLLVNAKSPYDLKLSAKFTVGSDADAKTLVAGKTLGVTASLENNGTTAQDVVVIVVLYNENGAMVDLKTKPATVSGSGSATVNIDNAFTLPKKIDGYQAVLMTWDGSSLSSSKLIPKSNFIVLQ